jgi:decaprenylphospho-beta-D-erythro-pentofuranosid-2-ulose 2-reductase
VRDALGAVQSVVVLGGTSEIGLATVRALAQRRALRVVLAARDPGRLDEPGSELRSAGAEAVDTLRWDATDPPKEQAGAVGRAFELAGDVDLVLVAAGVLPDQDRAAADPAAAAEVMQVNLVGPVTAIVEAARRLRAQGHGTLVVLSTVAAERARKSNFVYGASKAGLDAFCQGLGDSLDGTCVRVMVVRPGFVHTRMTAGMAPGPLATTPEAVAAAIADGIAGDRHTVWVPGPLRFVMSALRHLPRPIFRRLNV